MPNCNLLKTSLSWRSFGYSSKNTEESFSVAVVLGIEKDQWCLKPVLTYSVKNASTIQLKAETESVQCVELNLLKQTFTKLCCLDGSNSGGFDLYSLDLFVIIQHLI